MKKTDISKIDFQGLRRAVTTMAVAAALAGCAVAARPEATTTSSQTLTVAPAVSSLRQVSAPQASASLRQVAAAPAPITSTRSSQ